VDFVWISNGTELEKVEGVDRISEIDDSVMFTDYYIISQLSTEYNNSLYTCEVVINISDNQIISATGNFRINITGKLIM